ncbi:alpha-hydroxy-acid oxidizing protein, partial [Coleofasciculus sp. H7-2]|uniref:alpha-hydroxy-acid oxidizing protein n=1 Tax=Coleofasciculus sp. H7-2 TaxID=3351545 RepID=UPI00367043CB
EVVAAVGDTAEVLVDGGIRRGTDVLKALAFWNFCGMNLMRAIALSGCAKLQDIDPSLMVRL